jgi:hypothetical protein
VRVDAVVAAVCGRALDSAGGVVNAPLALNLVVSGTRGSITSAGERASGRADKRERYTRATGLILDVVSLSYFLDVVSLQLLSMWN